MKIPIDVELKEESKSISKLLEVVAKTIGYVGIPLQKHLENKVESAALVGRAKAENEVAELREFAKMRREHLELRRTRNIRTVIQKTIPLLGDSPGAEAVDEDWANQFFEHVQDVSHEEMQRLWARVLAGEVNSPGSFATRTLECLKTFARWEAEMFTRLVSFSWTNSMGAPFIIDTEILRRHWCPETEYVFSSIKAKSAIEHMKHVGLLGPSDTIYPVSALRGQPFCYFGRTFVFDVPDGPKRTEPPRRNESIDLNEAGGLIASWWGRERVIGELYFTSTGIELRKIASQEPIPGYATEAMEYESKELGVPFREIGSKE
jgi:hypothetical protein